MKNLLTGFLLTCLLALCVPSAALVVVDESFEGYAIGELGGQGGWSMGYVTTVAYEGDVAPPKTAPGSWGNWVVEEGKVPPNSSFDWTSSADILDLNDNGTVSGQDKIKWRMSVEELNNSVGSTVNARIRCATYTVGGSIDFHGNIFVYDGAYQAQLAVLSDRVRVANMTGTNEYFLDGTAWHTYTMTVKGTKVRVYVDGSSTAVIDGDLTSWTSERKILFGSGNSSGKQRIYIDYIRWRTDGALAPSIENVMPEVVGSPVRYGFQGAKWYCGPGGGQIAINRDFLARWHDGIATMYLSLMINATDGPGNFSYIRLRDEDGDEGPRICINRGAGQTGSIGAYNGVTPQTLIANPLNNQWYNIKLVCNMDTKRYDAYYGDGDRTGQTGHWTLGQSNLAFVEVDCDGLAAVNWRMDQLAEQFSGTARVYMDDLYIEGPDILMGTHATEIWVADGTYVEKITLPQDVHLCGGFAGNEASKAERNGQNSAVLNAGDSAVGSSAVTGSFLSSIEGFAITGGYYGVNCGNTYMSVVNNLIKGNAQAGVFCGTGSPDIINNTIIANTTGITANAGSAKLTNNIITQNTTGVSSSGGTHTLSHNNVFGNTTNYSGTVPGQSDFSKDPMFANAATGDYHLQFGSPCIDAGVADALSFFDRDGKYRPIDGNGDGWDDIDMGAYESQFTPELVAMNGLRDKQDNSIIRLVDAVVTAQWPDSFYVEMDNRSFGIRVDKAGHGLAESVRANLSGRVKTDSQGERYIEAITARQNGSGSIEPLLMSNRSLGGAQFGQQLPVGSGVGVNSTGLLVRAVGLVSEIDTSSNPASFMIDDLSKMRVKVVVPPTVTINPNWRYVRVTGASSCCKVGEQLLPMIRVRRQEDVEGVVVE